MSTELDAQIGKRLERRRTDLGIPPNELAIMASIRIEHLHRIEAGEERPSAKLLLRLCHLLDVKLSELLIDLAVTTSSPSKHRSAVVIDFPTKRPRN